MKQLKIGFLGTRGIPNRYGGFEQAVERLSVGLAEMGHDVTVYNSHQHPYKEEWFHGVRIVRRYDPEHLIKTAGQFIYDLNCIRDAHKKKFDVILFMGYTSSSVWWRYFPKKSTIISNMDGLEWQRSKYSAFVQKFLKKAERWAAMHSDFLVADSMGIREYLKDRYEKDSAFIPYGADTNLTLLPGFLSEMKLQPFEYFMLLSRMEPENHLDMILEGFSASNSGKQFLVAGGPENRYGKKLRKKYASDQRIRFIGPVYDQEKVHTLRHYAAIYFHGHSVGGTNPSLLDAMASKAAIVAHDNIFNRSVLENDGYYFSSADDVKKLIEQGEIVRGKFAENNFTKIQNLYNWPNITRMYADFISRCYWEKNHEKTLYHRGQTV